MQLPIPSDYSDTPTRLPPAPRRVRALFGPMGWVAFSGYVAGLVWAGGYLLLLLCTLYFGVDVPARVMNVAVSRSSKHTSNNVYYSYTVRGQRYDESVGVSLAVYEQFETALRSKDPTKRDATVRLLEAGPIRYVDFTPDSRLVSNLPIPIGIAVILFCFRYIFCLQFRMLYKYGRAVTGVVVDKYTRSGKDTRYYVVYTFPDPNGGKEIRGKYDCGQPARYHEARVGESVTVLYYALSLRRSVPYELGAYRVVLPDGSAPRRARV